MYVCAYCGFEGTVHHWSQCDVELEEIRKCWVWENPAVVSWTNLFCFLVFPPRLLSSVFPTIPSAHLRGAACDALHNINCKYTNTQLHKYRCDNTQIHKHTDIQICKIKFHLPISEVQSVMHGIIKLQIQSDTSEVCNLQCAAQCTVQNRKRQPTLEAHWPV